MVTRDLNKRKHGRYPSFRLQAFDSEHAKKIIPESFEMSFFAQQLLN